MSVEYNGKKYNVKEKNGFLTLNISNKKINNISQIKGLEILKDLEVLKLNNN